jgi:hypothetical protein
LGLESPRDRRSLWVGIAGLWALKSSDIRRSCWQVVAAFFHPKVTATVLMAAAYCAGLIWIGTEIGIWTTSLINDTVIWFVSVALVLMFSSHHIGHDEHYVGRAFRRTVTAAVLIDGAVNLFVLPLPVELLLFPSGSCLVLMVVVAGEKEEYALVVKLINGLLGVIGTGLLLYVVIDLAVSHGTVDWTQIGLQLVLPVWLTIAVLPFIYVMGTYAVLESTFTRIDFFGERIGRRRFALQRPKLALLIGTRCRAQLVGGFVSPWPKRLARSSSFKASLAVLAEYRSGEHSSPEDLAAMARAE